MKHVIRRRAFSLIELLIVIGIIAALLGILLPALAAAREHARRVVCVSNARQLTMAWIMYANENRGRLCPASPVYASHPNYCWLGPDGNPQNGLLWHYVGDARVYLCPNPISPSPTWSGPLPRVSYAINGGLNGGFYNTDFGQHTMRVTLVQIKRPVTTFVFIEPLSPQCCLTGYTPASWIPVGVEGIHGQSYAVITTPPGRQHSLSGGNGTSISFADGHALFYSYSDKTTYTDPINQMTTRNSPDAWQLAAWNGEFPPPGYGE